MARSIFSQPQFNDEAAAYAFVEARLWPDGPVCPHCGVIGKAGKLSGKTDRVGSYKCYACRKKFTVKIGTIFEDSHIAMRDWLTAIHLLCSSKKGMSANQLSRTLGVTLKSAWFLGHRIREAMVDGSLRGIEPLGGDGKIVEADETVIGGKERNKHKSKRNPRNIGAVGKAIVFTLVERDGRARSHHVPEVSANTLRPIMDAQIDHNSFLMTDEAGQYRLIGPDFARHEKVNHGVEEYVRGAAHVNTAEGYFSLLKRGINGIYHHVSQQHLKRYLAEFDFRYSNRVRLGVNDEMRAERALRGAVGKRLTYRDS
jgi:transposase-like protein